jgi:hypothetical protein
MSKNKFKAKKILGLCSLILAVIVSATVAFSHGGKHAEEFTPLQALKKATELYDRLIENGKLDQGWENNLSRAEVSKMLKGNKKEIVVSFYRLDGEPKTVYIFFKPDGKYAGSNFTGE